LAATWFVKFINFYQNSDYFIFDNTDFEKRALEAAAVVQQELNAPVSLHPGRNPGSPAQILRHFLEAGGDASRVALCHLDSKVKIMLLSYLFYLYSFFTYSGTILENDILLEFASLGSYLEFDLFGIEVLI